MLDRTSMLARLQDEREPWDLLVVGGGATGVGTALDAAARGWRVALLEQADFGKGTSSRSTKLVHGGVRYLRQGNVPLVREALAEREVLRRNAPQHVRDLEFVIPCTRRGEVPFYRAGTWVYDRLAGSSAFGRSRTLSRTEVVARVPNVRTADLRGGVAYHDGQFDDARLLIDLAATAAERGAVLLNYVRVTGLARPRPDAPFEVRATDEETGERHRVAAHGVVNATGPFADGLRRMEAPRAPRLVAPSRGVHLVLDGSFLGGDAAVMIPRTEDGRVIFAIPWRERVLVGTTDTPVREVSLEPRASREEVDFLLRTVGRHLARAPTESDVRSVFAGVRPLVRAGGSGRTSALSRDHVIRVGPTGMITVCGGKWTTYRRMAEQTVDRAERVLRRPHRPSVTRHVRIHGPDRSTASPDGVPDTRPIHPRLRTTAGEVVRTLREEMARTVDDVLSRRTRDLVLDAAAAREAAPFVADLLARELGRDAAWRDAEVARFEEVALAALPSGSAGTGAAVSDV